jgi:hypothetical protein
VWEAVASDHRTRGATSPTTAIEARFTGPLTNEPYRLP